MTKRVVGCAKGGEGVWERGTQSEGCHRTHTYPCHMLCDHGVTAILQGYQGAEDQPRRHTFSNPNSAPTAPTAAPCGPQIMNAPHCSDLLTLCTKQQWEDSPNWLLLLLCCCTPIPLHILD